MSRSKENDESNRTENKQKACSWDEVLTARSCPDAMAKMLAKFDRLVELKVRKFLGRGIGKDDLKQIGLFALQVAINEISVDRVDSFLSYAATAIDHAIVDELRENAPATRHQWDMHAQFSKVESELFEELGTKVPPSEVYARLGWSERKIKNHQSCCSQKVQSLCGLAIPLEDGTAGIEFEKTNIPGSESNYSDEIRQKMKLLDCAVNDLPPDERDLIEARYWRKTSQKNYAKQNNITEHKVKTTERRVLAKLKLACDVDAHDDKGTEG